MTIWRVENKEGIGCYRKETGFISEYFTKKHDEYKMSTHPLPQLDKGINRNMISGEICGFRNLKQAKDWFTRIDLIILKHFGFRLKQVEVIQITAIGQKQVLAVK